jgi:flavin-dependent dehydrogenase
MKQKLSEYGYSFGEPARSESCLILRPGGFSRHCLGEDGAFLIGEAAGLISPSLEGISYALNSGAVLSTVLNSGASRPNSEYARKMAGVRADLLMRHIKSLFYYTPLARKIIMKSGINSIRVMPLS